MKEITKLFLDKIDGFKETLKDENLRIIKREITTSTTALEQNRLDDYNISYISFSEIEE